MITEAVVVTTVTSRIDLQPDGTVAGIEHTLTIADTSQMLEEKALRYVGVDALSSAYTNLFADVKAEEEAEGAALKKKN